MDLGFINLVLILWTLGKHLIRGFIGIVMKTKSFFELKADMKLEATEELIKEMERRHQWKKLAELVKYKEELKSSKQGIMAAAGDAI